MTVEEVIQSDVLVSSVTELTSKDQNGYTGEFKNWFRDSIVHPLETLPLESLSPGPTFFVSDGQGTMIRIQCLHQDGPPPGVKHGYAHERNTYMVAYNGDRVVGFRAALMFQVGDHIRMTGSVATADEGKGYMSLLEAGFNEYKQLVARETGLPVDHLVTNRNLEDLGQFTNVLDLIRNQLAEARQRKAALGSENEPHSFANSLTEVQIDHEILILQKALGDFEAFLEDKKTQQERWQTTFQKRGFSPSAEEPGKLYKRTEATSGLKLSEVASVRVQRKKGQSEIVVDREEPRTAENFSPEAILSDWKINILPKIQGIVG